MKKQRSLSIKPDFIFPNYQNFYIHKVFNRNSLPLVITETELSNLVEKAPGLPRFYLKFKNVGNKGAKSVVGEWSFNKDIFLNLIRDEDEEDTFNILQHENYISLRMEDRGVAYRYNFTQLNNFERSFIPTYEVKNEQEKIPIPDGYLVLYLAHLYLYYNQDEETEPGTFNFSKPETPPSMQLKLNYEDLDGEKFEKSFEVIPQIHFLRKLPDQPDNGLVFKGEFKIEQNS